MMDAVHRWLERIRGGLRRRRRSEGLVAGGAFLAGALLLLAWADLALDLSLPVRRILLVSVVVAAVVRGVRRAALGRIGGLGPSELARWIEGRDERFNDLLVSAVELEAEGNRYAEFNSPTLARRAIEGASEAIRDVDPGGLLPPAEVRRPLAMLLVAAALAFLPGFVWNNYRLAWIRMVSDAGWPQRTHLRVVLPERGVLPRGAELAIEAHPREGSHRPETARIHFRHGEGEELRAEMDRFGDGHFAWSLDPVQQEILFYVRADDYDSREENGGEPYRVTVVPRPGIEDLTIELVYPAYTGREPERLAGAHEGGRGNLQVPVGTRLSVAVRTHKPIERADLAIGEEALPLERGDGEDPVWRGVFTADRTLVYHIRLEDRYGFENDRPVRYTIRAVEDRPPLVRIEEPARDIKVTPASVWPLRIRFEDDWGLARGELRWTRGVDGEEESVRVLFESDAPPGPERHAHGERAEDLVLDVAALLEGKIGDTFRIRAVGVDFDDMGAVAGKEGVSQTILVNVVSPADAAAEIKARLATIQDEVVRLKQYQEGLAAETASLMDLTEAAIHREAALGILSRQKGLRERSARLAVLIDDLRRTVLYLRIEDPRLEGTLQAVHDAMMGPVDIRLAEAEAALSDAVETPPGEGEAVPIALEREQAVVEEYDHVLSLLGKAATYAEVVYQVGRVRELTERIHEEIQRILQGGE